MTPLIDDLSSMCALRDRSALNVALVELVMRHFHASVRSAWLLRIVVDGKDRRCLSCAIQGVENVHPVRDSFWADWSVLPSLQEFALRQQALDGVQVAHAVAADGSCTTVFPMNKPMGYNAVLEIGSDQPLEATCVQLLQSILGHYQNLMGLLDYGEKDTLTELLNRKTFDYAFMKATVFQHNNVERQDSERRLLAPEGGYWLAILDIDHFKRVNDHCGHLIGDEVLLLLARLMRANFRFHDQMYRFGGEEFVVLMRCANQEHAGMALERLRQSVEAFSFPQAGKITISIGFTAVNANDTPNNAFGRADKAVYHAKEHGRNQVCNFQALVDQGLVAADMGEEMEVDLF